ncbi:heterogeneous nuclear ribonucleoprotein K isoform X2 [Photinus pyralis]|uniref:heterogeneous nuclear ribonucleoprotein K isoform X2 n=1 Tax=Photinus pyralis TaxID=7054 RepID=UPI001266F46E|nr:heterogeneous nuclear ribonucleoprotein K isoform X2 [Photinus pyralis]
MKREADGDMGAPFKRSRRGDEEVRILIPSKVAGAIIGKGGQNITKLRSQYKASITVPDCPGPERMLTLSSDLDTVCNIVNDVIPNLEENGGRINGDELDLRMMIHQSQAGCVIGKGGSKIKEIRDKTGARIKIFSNCAPQSTDRVIQMIGQPSKCIDTIREVLTLIKSSPIKGPVTPYDPHNFDDFYADEYGGYGNGQGGAGGGGGNENRRGSGGPPNRGMGGGPRGGGGNGGDRNGGGSGGGSGGGGRFNRGGGGPPRGGGSMGGGSFNDRGMGGGGGGGGGRGGGGGFGGGPSRGLNGGPSPFGRDEPWSNRPMNQQSGMMSGGGSHGPPHMGGGGSGMGGPNSGGGPGSTQVTIPKDLAGAIIGKGGGRIRKIRQDSGAGITIDEPLIGSNDRIITITGTQNQIQMAQYLLQQSVHNNTDRGGNY